MLLAKDFTNSWEDYTKCLEEMSIPNVKDNHHKKSNASNFQRKGKDG